MKKWLGIIFSGKSAKAWYALLATIAGGAVFELLGVNLTEQCQDQLTDLVGGTLGKVVNAAVSASPLGAVAAVAAWLKGNKS